MDLNNKTRAADELFGLYMGIVLSKAAPWKEGIIVHK